jgi:type II secretory pathway predicted ATPase ExeA
MDHLAWYGLQKEPFSIVPLTNFYFHNEQHDQAFMRLKHAAEGMRGLAVLSGEIGTGKTLLARRLLESLAETDYEASLLVVLHADVTGEWLIRRIAQQMGVSSDAGEKVAVLGALYQRLQEIASEGRKAVILIDEAHMLRSREVLEEVRGLLNLELPDAKLISIIFFGMPELTQCLASEPALQQRIAVRCHLRSFSPDVLADYVRFRLFHAGTSQNIFHPEAMEVVYRYSGGNPRLVNVLCDNALFEGYVRRAELPLKGEIIESVASDLGIVPRVAQDEPAERR